MGGVPDGVVCGTWRPRRARYGPTHPRIPRRTRLYRQDDALLLITDGQFDSFLMRFSSAELVEDSVER